MWTVGRRKVSYVLVFYNAHICLHKRKRHPQCASTYKKIPFSIQLDSSNAFIFFVVFVQITLNTLHKNFNFSLVQIIPRSNRIHIHILENMSGSFDVVSTHW
jgi:hypothetical protein